MAFHELRGMVWARIYIYDLYMKQVPTGESLTALNCSRWAVLLAFYRFGELSIRFTCTCLISFQESLLRHRHPLFQFLRPSIPPPRQNHHRRNRRHNCRLHRLFH